MDLSEEKIHTHPETECSLTKLTKYDLKMLQPIDGYRFSVDALLLAEFTKVKKKAKVAEFGAGVGVISLILSKKYPNAYFTGFEIQNALFELAKKNIEINGLSNVEVLNADIKELPKLFGPGSFDHVVTNPPFRPTNTGRLCPNTQEAISRHEILITLKDIIYVARWLLKPGGRLSIIYPSDRLSYLITTMSNNRIEPKRLRCIHPQKELNARLVLLEGIKDGGIELIIEPPLFLNS